MLAVTQKRSNWFHLLLLIENQTSKFLYGVKQERDAHFTIYFQAAVPGQKLEILHLGNFFRSHFLMAVSTINKIALKPLRSCLKNFSADLNSNQLIGVLPVIWHYLTHVCIFRKVGW